jgi:hypothetical protein
MTKPNWLSSHSVRSALPSLVWGSILCALLFTSIIFFKLPRQTVTTSVGSYLLSAFPTGLALYSGSNDGHYYSISPLNDYVITKDGFRMAIVSGEAFNEENFTAANSHNKVTRIIETIGNYFGWVAPSYTLNNPQHIEYQVSQLDSNTISITKNQTFAKNNTAQSSAMTVSYEPDDFVYSPETGSLFTEHTNSEIAWLKEITGISITQLLIPAEYEGTRLFTWEIDSKKVVIVNQNHAGYIVIEAKYNQTLLVNPKDHLIEVVDTVPQNSTTHTSSMTVQILEKMPK